MRLFETPKSVEFTLALLHHPRRTVYHTSNGSAPPETWLQRVGASSHFVAHTISVMHVRTRLGQKEPTVIPKIRSSGGGHTQAPKRPCTTLQNELPYAWKRIP